MELLQHCLQLFRDGQSKVCGVLDDAHALVGQIEENHCRAKYRTRSNDLHVQDVGNPHQQENQYLAADIKKSIFYKGRFLKIYNYHQDDDKMAALHAKVISVDQQQTLITSANLSYHGQQGNIELGTLIESKQIAKQIDDVFTKMIFSKVFSEV